MKIFYGNQYVKQTPRTGPFIAFTSGALLLAGILSPIGPDKNTQFLKQFSFGKVQAINIEANPNIAGTSAVLIKSAPVTKEDFINASKHPEEIMHIWEKETSKGKNTNPNALHNLCKAQGKSNEFGYGGMAMKICFHDFEEAVMVVDDWLTKRDMEALCYYNIGEKVSDCPYVAKLTSK